MTSRSPPWPRIPAGFVRAMLSGHSELGLAVGALIYLVCLTGTVAVFVNELQVWEQPNTPVVDRVGGDAIGRAFQHAAEAAAGHRLANAYVSLQAQDGQRFVVAARGEGFDESWVADVSGALVGRNDAPWTDFVGELHMTLLLPSPWGGIVVGMIGVALLSLIISGVLAHPRIFRDAFALRWAGSRRLREADLHNRLSVWGLPFHIAVTLTGAFFGLSFLLILVVATVAYHGDTRRVTQALDGPQVGAEDTPAPLPDIPALVAEAMARQPSGYPTYIGIERPGTAGQRVMMEVKLPRRLVRGERFYFDGKGAGLVTGGFASGAIGLQAYAAAASLHFGTFGGLPVKLAYGVLGLALSAISAGGISIWLIRRRDQGWALPRLEKAWSGIVWGAPFALCVSAMGSRMGAPPAPVFWGAAVGGVVLSLMTKDGTTASWLVRMALVLGLVGMVAADIAGFGRAALEGYAAGVNLALVGVAMTVGLALIRRAPPESPGYTP
jgi:uncharacterized iron-regulated membrane protein